MLQELIRMRENEQFEFKSDRNGQLKMDTIIEQLCALQIIKEDTY